MHRRRRLPNPGLHRSPHCRIYFRAGVLEGHITIEGDAPDRLTIALGVERGEEPSALWRRGERMETGQARDA